MKAGCSIENNASPETVFDYIYGENKLVLWVDYRFSSKGNGTKLDYSNEFLEANWLIQLLGKLFFNWYANRRHKAQMLKVKHLAEGANKSHQFTQPPW